MRLLLTLLVIFNQFIAKADPPQLSPTKEQVRAALEILKQAHVQVETSPFLYSQYGLKAMGAAAGLTGVSVLYTFTYQTLPLAIRSTRIAMALQTLSLGGMMIGVGSCGAAAGATGLLFLMESVRYLGKHAVLPAEGAELEGGVLADPVLMQRFLDLPIETQLKIAGPSVQARVIMLAKEAIASASRE